MQKVSVTIFILTAYISFLGFLTRFFIADIMHEQALDSFEAGNVKEALTQSNIAVKLNPWEPAYFRGRAKNLIAATMYKNDDEKAVIKKNALDDLNYSYKLNTTNLATIRNSVPLFYFLAIKDITQPADDKNFDNEYKKAAKDFINKVKNVSVNDAGMYILTAKYEKKLGMKKEHLDSVKRIKQLRPDLLLWHPDLLEK